MLFVGDADCSVAHAQRRSEPEVGESPLQDFSGTITPTDLHFERHHSGVPTIDPAEYRLMVHGLVERAMVFSLEDLGRFGPWLFRIAHNEAYSLLRKNRPETELGEERVEPVPGRKMLPMEVSLAVESALARLTEDQREAVVLKIYQGFKFEEMAEILSCPVSTVKSRLYTALDLLKDTLAPIQMRGAE